MVITQPNYFSLRNYLYDNVSLPREEKRKKKKKKKKKGNLGLWKIKTIILF